jgi:hypothetical protein
MSLAGGLGQLAKRKHNGLGVAQDFVNEIAMYHSGCTDALGERETSLFGLVTIEDVSKPRRLDRAISGFTRIFGRIATTHRQTLIGPG